MSTVATPAPKLATKIPSLSPWAAPNVICPNKTCNKILTPRVGKSKKGGDICLYYNCTDCKYDFESSLIHANGMCKPEGSFDPVDGK